MLSANEQSGLAMNLRIDLADNEITRKQYNHLRRNFIDLVGKMDDYMSQEWDRCYNEARRFVLESMATKKPKE